MTPTQFDQEFLEVFNSSYSFTSLGEKYFIRFDYDNGTCEVCQLDYWGNSFDLFSHSINYSHSVEQNIVTTVHQFDQMAQELA